MPDLSSDPVPHNAPARATKRRLTRKRPSSLTASANEVASGGTAREPLPFRDAVRDPSDLGPFEQPLGGEVEKEEEEEKEEEPGKARLYDGFCLVPRVAEAGGRALRWCFMAGQEGKAVGDGVRPARGTVFEAGNRVVGTAEAEGPLSELLQRGYP